MTDRYRLVAVTCTVAAVICSALNSFNPSYSAELLLYAACMFYSLPGIAGRR